MSVFSPNIALVMLRQWQCINLYITWLDLMFYISPIGPQVESTKYKCKWPPRCVMRLWCNHSNLLLMHLTTSFIVACMSSVHDMVTVFVKLLWTMQTSTNGPAWTSHPSDMLIVQLYNRMQQQEKVYTNGLLETLKILFTPMDRWHQLSSCNPTAQDMF